ncbi:hypothetical protein EXVG_00167 [Emiliania huxleyi virus 202]|nr:hypothetical protein EXVG_00167 [Emiliania huxleyi virus 202]AHA54399.1 hypothetical protein EhV18_00353 [Emiliania huxleyi virus 18]AHA55440.1 hypothetical protein EhV156_00345 [Emiliania huxleyi virus 156]
MALSTVNAIKEFLLIDTRSVSGHVLITALQNGFRLESELLAFSQSGAVMPAFYTEASEQIAIKLGEMSAVMRARKAQKRRGNMTRAMKAVASVRVV